MEHEQLILLEWLKNRAVLEESEYTQGKLRLAAATIERLQKEVERLTKERVIFTARSVIVTEDEAREMFPDPEAKQQASD